MTAKQVVLRAVVIVFVCVVPKATSFDALYLRIVSFGSKAKDATSFNCGQCSRFKLVKEVRVDRGATSFSWSQRDRFKLVKEVRVDRGDTSLS